MYDIKELRMESMGYCVLAWKSFYSLWVKYNIVEIATLCWVCIPSHPVLHISKKISECVAVGEAKKLSQLESVKKSNRHIGG